MNSTQYPRRVNLKNDRGRIFAHYPFNLPGVRPFIETELYPKETLLIGENRASWKPSP